ncbi:MAG: transketolase family protein [Bacteroidales bacterium]|nr:transketolase family protein [Bacteroidales bacterium]
MKYINQGNKAGRIGFGEGLLEAAKLNPNIVALGADITTSVGMHLFEEAFPNRFFSFGIAEQNIAAASTGLFLGGKIPVFSTYGVFAAHRAADQIRVSICYNKAHVLIGGAHAGISVGPDGATHQALEDIASMRVLPNMTVFSPCDATQAKQATIEALLNQKGPVYIRFGREAVPNFITDKHSFIPGKAQILKEGKDITIIATGHLVWEALLAAEKLEQQGFEAEVVNIHTIKPIDVETIIQSAKKTKKVITAEEHQIIGGLGSAVAEVLSQHQPTIMRMIGIKNTFGESGEANELMDIYGLRAINIVEKAIELL